MRKIKKKKITHTTIQWKQKFGISSASIIYNKPYPKKSFATATEIQLKGIMCLPVHRPLEFQNRRPQVRLLLLLVHPYVISINE